MTSHYFEKDNTLAEGSTMDLASKLPYGIAKYALYSSRKKSLNIIPRFTRLRRANISLLVEEILPVHVEFAKNGTVFGSPLRRNAEGYDQLKVKRFEAMVKEYLDTVIADGKFDTLNSPSSRELEEWVGKGGIIERSFDDEVRMRYFELESDGYASLSPKIDNAERAGLNLVEDVTIFCNNYIIRLFNRFIRKDLKESGPFYEYEGSTMRTIERIMRGTLVAIAVALPITVLTLIQNTKWGIIVAMVATFLNFQLCILILHPDTPSLIVICSSLAALYVVFISNNQFAPQSCINSGTSH